MKFLNVGDLQRGESLEREVVVSYSAIMRGEREFESCVMVAQKLAEGLESQSLVPKFETSYS